MPLVKLGYLLIRTVAKPVSGAIASYARDHPKFRAICIGVAQRYHRSEVKLRRGLMRRKVTHLPPPIKPLDTDKAFETGASFIGESIVFLVAGIFLIADQISARAKEKARREGVEERLLDLETNLIELRMMIITERIQDGKRPAAPPEPHRPPDRTAREAAA